MLLTLLLLFLVFLMGYAIYKGWLAPAGIAAEGLNKLEADGNELVGNLETTAGVKAAPSPVPTAPKV